MRQQFFETERNESKREKRKMKNLRAIELKGQEFIYTTRSSHVLRNSYKQMFSIIDSPLISMYATDELQRMTAEITIVVREEFEPFHLSVYGR